jgi:uncharacterized repeat protein (TIGR01451 family)
MQCTRGTLAAGASASFTLVGHLSASIPNASTLCNSANVATATSDPDTGNNIAATCATIETHADLALTKSGPTSAIAGTNASYALAITNAGPSDAQDAVLSDPLPAGASLVSITQNSGPVFICGLSTTVQCIRGSLASGASASFTLTVRFSPSVPDGSTRCNTGAIQSATTDDPDPTNNWATTCATVIARADLALAEQGSVTGTPGSGTATFNFTLRNLGPSDSQGVTFVAGVRFKIAPLLPPQVISSGANCSISALMVTCRWATIAFAATQAFTITVKWRSAVGDVCNDASVSSVTTDPGTTNNRTTLCVVKK